MSVDNPYHLIYGFLGALLPALGRPYYTYSATQTLPASYRKKTYWVLTFAMALFGGFLAFLLNTKTALQAFVIGASAPVFLYTLTRSQTKGLERQARQKLDEAERAIEKAPDKVAPYWDRASARLELYFQENLSQTRLIFWFTIVVLVAGFGLVCYGVVRAFNGGSIKAALLTAASGVLTEFIAATFLVLFKSTSTQASEFVVALERINAVGMALQTIDSIQEGGLELKNKTRAEIAIKILDVFKPDGKRTGPKPKTRVKKDSSD